MKKLIFLFNCIVIALSAMLLPDMVAAQRRVVVRHPVGVRRPIVRTRIVVRPGHPVRRVLPSTVVVRPARRVVTTMSPLVFLPGIAWRSSVASLPSADRLVWQDSETLERDEGWVDASFGIDGAGNALFLGVDGKGKFNFAEITFGNGQVQVIDFNEKTCSSGIYNLFDFADGRHVNTVRILARSESEETKLAVYLGK
jgi:hypothetical protein